MDGVEGGMSPRRPGVPGRGFCGLGAFRVRYFSVLCKVAKRIRLVRFRLSLNLATLTYETLILMLRHTYAWAMMPL